LPELLKQGKLQDQFLHTLSISLAGWLIATALGLIMGIAIAWSRVVWTYTMATIDVLRSIPSISLVSVALLMFGFSSNMELVIVVYVSQWPVLLATAGGLRTTPDTPRCDSHPATIACGVNI
jgi:ABC-type nitrate/sulfonate/bicarbonate transport system permease component